ncbi:MAG TPA: HAD-IC family P-type ATPase, partial [Candidatus Binataceae bacterium]|nr:HAD-IC family P-type ATPase [Candidatus Binataceae bacterium]
MDPIHTAVPGRARYRVAGLRRSESVKKLLEGSLPEIAGIDQVSANTLTGNVLVLFDGKMSARHVAALIEGVLSNGTNPGANNNNDRGGASSSARFARKAVANEATRMPVSGNGRPSREDPPPAGDAPPPAWHAMDANAVLARCKTSPKGGLSEKVAVKRLKSDGPNVLPELEPRSQLSILLDQFNSWPVALLSAAAGISLLTGGLGDVVAIAGVVAINAVIGYVTESQSEKTIRSLSSLVQPAAVVVREGKLREIPARETVAGDLLVLKPGSCVAADCRLIEVHHLTVDESTLTGESMPVTKLATALSASEVPLPDRLNMVYMGTLVTGGQGLAVVVATGASSEIGKIQKLAQGAESPQTPMERQLARIGNQLVLIASGVCGGVFLVGLLRGYGFLEMLRSSIALAVAAVPEGLPTVATTTLALGVLNMRKHRVIVRRLDAVETLGCVQTICLDKTGTLTLNRMAVVGAHSGMKRFRVEDGQFFDDEKRIEVLDGEKAGMAEVCALCSESLIEKQAEQYVLKGSSTENALIQMALGARVDVLRLREECPVLRIVARSEDRNFMTTLHRISPGASQFRGPFLVAVK